MDSPWCSVTGLPPSTSRVTARSGGDEEYRMPLTWMRGSPADRSGGSGRATLGAGAAGRTGAAGGGLVAALLRRSAGAGAGTGAATGRCGAAVAAGGAGRCGAAVAADGGVGT